MRKSTSNAISSMSMRCYQKLIDHAMSTYPEEVCGVLLSSEESNTCITNIIPINNVHPNKMKNFAFDPEQWVHVYFYAQQQKQVIVGIYHSHPTTEATPSLDDIAGWIDEQLLYAIISLKQKNSPQIQLFRKNGMHQFVSYPLALA